jgi:hypothetical protein
MSTAEERQPERHPFHTDLDAQTLANKLFGADESVLQKIFSQDSYARIVQRIRFSRMRDDAASGNPFLLKVDWQGGQGIVDTVYAQGTAGFSESSDEPTIDVRGIAVIATGPEAIPEMIRELYERQHPHFQLIETSWLDIVPGALGETGSAEGA